MKKTLFLSLAIILLLSGCGLADKNKQAEKENVLTPEKAQTEAEKFINDNLIPSDSEQKATVAGATEEDSFYKLDVKVADQSIESYMTKDGKMFFPEAMNMESPGSPVQGGASQGNAPQQQEMSIEEQSQAVVTQSKDLIKQLGDGIDEQTKNDLQEKVDELEGMNNSEDTNSEELRNKIMEIQKLVRPIITEMSEQSVNQEEQAEQSTDQEEQAEQSADQEE